MIELALSEDGKPLTTGTIAERQGISERYLDQIMIPLKRAGLVKSLRGAHGGYIIAKKAEDILAGDIIRALEGPIAPVDCVSENNPEDCKRSGICATKKLWSELRDSISKVLDSNTLYDLAKESERLNREQVIIYEI